MLNFFKSKPEPTREPSMQEVRASRKRELLAKLDRLNAETEELSTRISTFLLEHKGPDGRYRAGSLAELAQLPQQEISLRQLEWKLNHERNAILSELSMLTENKNESVHVEGRLVSRA